MVARIVCSVALVAVVAATVDFGAIGRHLRNAQPATAMVVIGLFCVVHVLSGVRWHLLLLRAGYRIPLRGELSAVWRAAFLSQVLPTWITSDAVRAWHSTRAGVPLPSSLQAVAADRAIGAAAILVAALLAAPILLRDVPLASSLPLVLIAAGGLATGVTAIVLLTGARRRAGRLGAAFNLLRDTAEAIGSIRDPAGVTTIGGSALLMIAVLAAALAAAARSLSVELSFLEAAAVTPAILLAVYVPISAGGWGVREAVMVHYLPAFGPSSQEAFALSVSFGLLQAAAALPGGGLVLLAALRDLRRNRTGDGQAGAAPAA